jgi:hypothetical protein
MFYYFSETQDNGSYRKWELIKAKDLRAAKARALRKQLFQGTYLHVGIKDSDDEISTIATRFPKNDYFRQGWIDWIAAPSQPNEYLQSKFNDY